MTRFSTFLRPRTSRLRVEQLLSNAFAGFQGDLRGTYYKLGALTDAQKHRLAEAMRVEQFEAGEAVC